MGWMGEWPWLEFHHVPDRAFQTGLLGLRTITLRLGEHDKGAALAQDCGHPRANRLGEAISVLDANASPDFEDCDSDLVLLCRASPDILGAVLDRRALSANATSRGGNAMQGAARCGYVDHVELLHERGARVPSPPGLELALRLAVYFGHYEAVEYSLDNGADQDINKDGKVGPLAHSAAAHGQLKILQLLVSRGGRSQTSLDARKRKSLPVVE